MLRASLLAALALALAACGGSDGPVEPRLSSIQAQIFSPSCAAFSACHSPSGRAGQCDLSAGHAYASLVGKTSSTNPAKVLVVPGAPDESFLVQKLRGDLGPDEGDRMPFGNPPLPADRIQAIEDWIAAGAGAD